MTYSFYIGLYDKNLQKSWFWYSMVSILLGTRPKTCETSKLKLPPPLPQHQQILSATRPPTDPQSRGKASPTCVSGQIQLCVRLPTVANGENNFTDFTERQRETKREREKERESETNAHTQRDTEAQTETETEREGGRERGRDRERQSEQATSAQSSNQGFRRAYHVALL